MSDNSKVDRRRFFGSAAITIAAAQLGALGSAKAQGSDAKTTDTTSARTPNPGTHTSFASLKQINAGLLTIGYAEAGPSAGNPVILLHG